MMVLEKINSVEHKQVHPRSLLPKLLYIKIVQICDMHFTNKIFCVHRLRFAFLVCCCLVIVQPYSASTKEADYDYYEDYDYDYVETDIGATGCGLSDCVQISECECELFKMKTKNYKPKTCKIDGQRYVGGQALVCCDKSERCSKRNSKLKEMVTDTTTSANVRAPPAPSREGRRRSQEACQRYSQQFCSETRSARMAMETTTEQVFRLLVFGGFESKQNQYPHMVAILSGSNLFCGGTLISEKHILTAAHCFKEPVSDLKVRLGEHNLVSSSGDHNIQELTISKIILHPEYKAALSYNDIAILEMSTPAVISDVVRPACLGTGPLSSSRAIAIGWGHTEHSDREISKTLQMVELPIVPNWVCKAKFNRPGLRLRALKQGILQSQMCAGDLRKGGIDTCQDSEIAIHRPRPSQIFQWFDILTNLTSPSNFQLRSPLLGDSGGPLQIQRPDQCSYDVIGVTSNGVGCGHRDFPGVYTRVSSFLEWIESVVWPDV